MKSSAVLTQEAFYASVGVEEHLGFITKLLGTYEIKNELKDIVLKNVSRIKKRALDPNLYIGVVGEFSSGKSTLLNAFLRDNFLKTDVLQATTSAVTIIRYGEKYRVQVTLLDSCGAVVYTEYSEKNASNQTIATLKINSNAALRYPNNLEETQFIESEQKEIIEKTSPFYKWFREFKAKTDFNSIGEFVHEITTNEEIAQAVVQVEIFHPAAILKEGLILIDTPGANVTNKRHVNLAKQAMQERCDAAVIVIPANIPLSSSLVDFLKESFDNTLHRCVYFVSKMDLIRQREKINLVSNLQKRISRELNIDHPILLSGVPYYVVEACDDSDENLDNQLSQNQKKEYIQEFISEETKFLSIFTRQKYILIAEMLSYQLSDLLSTLRKELEDHEQAYQKRQHALEKRRVPSLNVYVKKCIADYSNNFQNRTQKYSGNIENLYDDILLKLQNKTKKEIMEIVNNEGISSYLNGDLKNTFVKFENQINNRLQNVNKEIMNDSQEVRMEFDHHFRSVFNKLASLSHDKVSMIATGRFPDTEVSRILDGDQIPLVQEFDRLLAKIKEDTQSATASGAALGLAAGIILPGLGNLAGAGIGALAGWIWGKMNTPSIDEIKQKCLDDLDSFIYSTLQKKRQETLNFYSDSIMDMNKNLQNFIKKRFKSYETIAGKIIREIENESIELGKLQKEINRDIQRIDERQKNLALVIAALRNHGHFNS